MHLVLPAQGLLSPVWQLTAFPAAPGTGKLSQDTEGLLKQVTIANQTAEDPASFELYRQCEAAAGFTTQGRGWNARLRFGNCLQL